MPSMLLERNNSVFTEVKYAITHQPLHAYSLQFTLLEGQPSLNKLYMDRLE